MLKTIIIAVVFSLALLGGGLGALLFIAGDGEKKEEAAPVVTAEEEREALLKEIEKERRKNAKNAKEEASWQTYHCAYMHDYYAFHEDERELRLAELLGLKPWATKKEIAKRCREILPSVKLMGGMPGVGQGQDNIVVCEGVKFRLNGNVRLTVIPRKKDLVQGKVGYIMSGKTRFQKVYRDHTVKLAKLIPLILQVDDRCVMIGSPKIGRSRVLVGQLHLPEKFAVGKKK